MPATNKYFDAPPGRPEHPRVRAWRSYRKDPSVDHVGVEVLRERDGLTLRSARLFVSFYRQDGEILRQDEAPWEPELETWLMTWRPS